MEPGTKANAAEAIELVKLLQEGGEDVLGDIARISVLKTTLPAPGINRPAVAVHELVPGFGVCGEKRQAHQEQGRTPLRQRLAHTSILQADPGKDSLP